MKRLLLLLLCMLAYMPAAFASTWQEDVEAVTSHPEKVYEVYCGMPYEDFEQTWENVPNWSCKEISHLWIACQAADSYTVIHLDSSSIGFPVCRSYRRSVPFIGISIQYEFPVSRPHLTNASVRASFKSSIS